MVIIEKLKFNSKNLFKWEQLEKELLKEVTNERHQDDFNKKHRNLALKGFDRYDTFFEYPDRDANGNITGFTKYKATILVRCASDDKYYLYDIIDIKK